MSEFQKEEGDVTNTDEKISQCSPKIDQRQKGIERRVNIHLVEAMVPFLIR